MHYSPSMYDDGMVATPPLGSSDLLNDIQEAFWLGAQPSR